MAAAWLRPAGWACAAVLLLAGCTYDTTEPGLFPSPRPTAATDAPRERFKPKPTNPELPVLGERLWVSGDSRLPITFRYAVHAVRRMEGATVLDWSVTPVGAPGFGFGDSLPATDLGLEVGVRLAVTLVDPQGRTVYQPLMHRSREEFNHCLCVPLVRLKLDLRVGETRLMQITYPALPKSLRFVDVSLNTVTPIRHVPVSPLGTVPVALRPTDLARPGELPKRDRQRIDFPNPTESDQLQRIEVTRVLAGPGGSTLEWTLTSLDEQANRVLDYGPPVESTPPEGVEVVGSSQASGPVLRIGATSLRNLWSRTTVFNRTAYECQCTEIGLWATGLRNPGVSANLVTNYPSLPAGTRTVDVEFPGFGSLRGLAVTAVEDAARNVRAPEPARTGRWAYEVKDPPYGWPTAEWPTDLPDPAQLAEYEQYVEPLVAVPTR